MINKKFHSKIRKVGDSNMIVVPARLINEEKLKDYGTYEFAILKEVDTDIEIRKYRCLVCYHEFDSDECNPYCPACGNESVKEVRE